VRRTAQQLEPRGHRLGGRARGAAFGGLPAQLRLHFDELLLASALEQLAGHARGEQGHGQEERENPHGSAHLLEIDRAPRPFERLAHVSQVSR